MIKLRVRPIMRCSMMCLMAACAAIAIIIVIGSVPGARLAAFGQNPGSYYAQQPTNGPYFTQHPTQIAFQSQDRVNPVVVHDNAVTGLPESDRDHDIKTQTSLAVQRIRAYTTESEKERAKEELKRLLEEQFDARQETRRKMLETLKRQVVEIEDALEKRDSNRDEIVQRRMDELTGTPNALSWDDSASFSGPNRNPLTLPNNFGLQQSYNGAPLQGGYAPMPTLSQPRSPGEHLGYNSSRVPPSNPTNPQSPNDPRNLSDGLPPNYGSSTANTYNTPNPGYAPSQTRSVPTQQRSASNHNNPSASMNGSAPSQRSYGTSQPPYGISPQNEPMPPNANGWPMPPNANSWIQDRSAHAEYDALKKQYEELQRSFKELKQSGEKPHEKIDTAVSPEKE